MAPYFQKVEKHLEVGPSPRRHVGPIADVFQRGCDALGWKHGYLLRNAPGCEASGFCDFGCRTDARRSTNVAYLPPALERGSLLLTGLKAEQVLLENGRAVGIEGSAEDGRRLRIRAKVVILAGGYHPHAALAAEAEPRQLQRARREKPDVASELCAVRSVRRGDSRIRLHPSGLRLSRSSSGRAFSCSRHSPASTSRRVSSPPPGGASCKSSHSCSHLASFGPLAADATRNGRVWREFNGLPAIRYNLAPADVERLHRGLVLCMEMAVAAGARHFYPGVLSHPSLDVKRDLDRFRKAALSPRDLVLGSYHPLGTCAMGRDARTSVVGLDHQSHDVKGLFIVDGSTVRGPLGVNPQLTIMAMATRAAEQIASHLS